MASLDIVIMAAGKGTRMKSERPKVLHRLAGKSLLQHVLDAVAGLGAAHTLVVTGHGAETVEAETRAQGLNFVRQQPQLGTGHAVQQVVPCLSHDGTTLILNGDVPLIEPATAAALIAACGGTKLALLTIELADATGYGRIVREGQSVRAIVEHKDASAAQPSVYLEDLTSPEVRDAIAQMIIPGSSLIISDQGLGDETGEGTDFIVVTR